MPSHAGLVASHIQNSIDPTQLPPKDLVDHSAVCTLYLEARVSSFKCAYHSAIFQWTVHVGRHMQFKVWLTSVQQILLVGDI